MLLPLKTLTADTAAKVVTPVVSTFGHVAPMANGRGIILTDRMENITKIRGLLDELDQGPPTTPPGERALRSFVLKHASARDMAAMITTLFGVGGPNVMQAYDAAVAKAEENGDKDGPDFRSVLAAAGPDPVKATADERTNTLFVVGPADKLAMVEQVVKQLDEEAGQGTGTEMRIFKLQHARAEDVANTIRQALPPTPPPPSGGGGYRMPAFLATSPVMQTRVVADTTTNSLIVSAPLDQMKRIEDLIKEIDQGSTSPGGVRVFHLKVADAAQAVGIVANSIRRLDADGQQRRGSPAQVSADGRTNCLIVAGTGGDIQAAAALIEELDKPLDVKDMGARSMSFN